VGVVGTGVVGVVGVARMVGVVGVGGVARVVGVVGVAGVAGVVGVAEVAGVAGVVGVKARGSARVAHSHSGSYQEARCSCTGQGAIPSSHEEGLLLASKSDLQDIFALRVRKSVPDTGT
jgi:hypothetical protein